MPKNLEGKYIDKNMARLFFGGLDMTVSILVDKMKEMGMDQSYIDKVQKWEASAFPSMIRATDPDYYPSDFHTILHGDLWVNNQMFRYNEQKQLEDVKFVDFQFSYYGNPMCDLIYFLFTSLKPELVVEHLDDLVAYYHAQLVNAMAVLKVTTNPPSLDQLQIQLQRAGPFGMSLFYPSGVSLLLTKSFHLPSYNLEHSLWNYPCRPGWNPYGSYGNIERLSGENYRSRFRDKDASINGEQFSV